MQSKRRLFTRAKTLMGCLCLLASTALPAPAVTPAAPGNPGPATKSKMVPLVSDACPVVHGSDWLTIEWYPGFDEADLVANLRTFTLTFSPLKADGVNVNDHQRFTLGGGAWRSKVTPSANGYFHIEVPVPRSLPPGTYRVVDAGATPLLPARYRHLKLKMTNSPVNRRLCITVEGTQPEAQQQSASDAQ